jgi:DNA polymerase-3 subunit delta'
MSDLNYPWHDSYWQHLVAYVEQQRIPQALLLKGAAGLGKHQLALHFAQYLMCLAPDKQSFCHHCVSCKLFMAETHPDFMLLQPEEPGKLIGIDVIRQLIAKLALKPQYSAYRVVIINLAEHMNRNSANAFLKCLEEPPERTVFILLTEQVQRLPATIISRCQKLTLTTPDVAVAQQWLTAQGINAQQQQLLSLAQGAPLLALDYAQQNSLQLRNACFTDWQNIIVRHACPVALAEQWHKLAGQPLLHWLISWTEDIIKCHFQVQAHYLHNTDLASALQGLTRQVQLTRLFDFYGLLMKDIHRIQTQLNKQLLFEEILITWSQARAN